MSIKEQPGVWKRFNRGRAGKLWFEHEVLAMLHRSWAHPIVEEYARLLAEFERSVPERAAPPRSGSGADVSLPEEPAFI